MFLKNISYTNYILHIWLPYRLRGYHHYLRCTVNLEIELYTSIQLDSLAAREPLNMFSMDINNSLMTCLIPQGVDARGPKGNQERWKLLLDLPPGQLGRILPGKFWFGSTPSEIMISVGFLWWYAKNCPESFCASHSNIIFCSVWFSSL